MTFLKICGITSVADALLAVEAGADALGLNFVPSSKRVIDRASAAQIADAVGDRAELVAVVADRDLDYLEELRDDTGIRWLQLHGHESPSDLEAVLPEAFKAVPIATAADAEHAARYAGARLLVDAKSVGELGGTGKRFDWELARPLVGRYRLIVAGGLDPSNVGAAIAALRPYGVDVASGVEAPGNPRQKDPERVRAFIAAARAADADR